MIEQIDGLAECGDLQQDYPENGDHISWLIRDSLSPLAVYFLGDCRERQIEIFQKQGGALEALVIRAKATFERFNIPMIVINQFTTGGAND